MSDGTPILKKRGRKPKNKLIVQSSTIIEEPIDTEKEVIITYLPITVDDFNDKESVFIKSEKHIDNNYIETNEKIEKTEMLSDTDIQSFNGIYINKINIHNININSETKCWWCKHSFNTPNIVLPEQYYDGVFYCIGNFCSYNCAKAYNIDLHDINIWKRESLINLMYYMTYNIHKKIEPAPSWLILSDYGGCININEFRKNFEVNNSEYLLLHPPLISRQMQIEESYKIGNTNTSNKLDKLFSSDNTLSLRRSKPVETTQLNLEMTMGLRRK